MMNNDTDGSDNGSFDDDDDDDDDDKLNNRSPLVDKCPNEVIGIESIYACFTRRYSACPAFFTGILQEACQAALDSTIIEERRPVLVYIHYDRSIFSNIFCSKIFCSEIITDYLLNNYIVWPWDITFESNKNTLIEVWNNLFGIQSLDLFSIEQCPMLIGIMHRSSEEKGWICTSEYAFKTLLKSDTLTRTEEKSNRETLLRELIVFKEKCDKIEQALLFDFISKTGLCWEVVLEITKYLTLNDAIKAFSERILSLLRQYRTRVQLSDPSNMFINMVLQRIKSNQIVSLRLNTLLYTSASEFATFAGLTDVISLNLLNFHYTYAINKYEEYFPKLMRISLWYDNEVDFNILTPILKQLHRRIKRLEIHCGGVVCTHTYLNSLRMGYIKNFTIEYLLIDVGHFTLPSTNECHENYASCFLMTIIDLIKTMPNIRHVRVITNKYNLEELLDTNQWKTLPNVCYQLKTITMEIWGNILEKEVLSQKTVEIQKIMHDEKQKVKFQFVFI